MGPKQVNTFEESVLGMNPEHPRGRSGSVQVSQYCGPACRLLPALAQRPAPGSEPCQSPGVWSAGPVLLTVPVLPSLCASVGI